MNNLIKSLLILILTASQSQASCKKMDESKLEGKFKIISIKELRVSCVLKSEIMIATEKAELKVSGCVVDLVSDKVPSVRISVMMTGNECKLEKGASISGVFSTNRNTCCAVAASFRGVGPKCSRDDSTSIITLNRDLSDSEKMCSSGVEWTLLEKTGEKNN